MKVTDAGEMAIIERLRQRSNYYHDAIIGIGDDCAVTRQDGSRLLLLTTDLLIEGVHFIRGQISFLDLGYKSLAVNLSDIAAMGGTPRYALVSLGLPADLSMEELDRFYQGLYELADLMKVDIVGGDLSSSPRLFISITLTGEVESHHMLRQDRAREGDLVAVTGDLGGSAAGLALLMNSHLEVSADIRQSALAKHYRPWPHIQIGRELAQSGKVTAAKDISDGLSKEINIVAHSSGTGARIYAEHIPLSDCTRYIAEKMQIDPLQWALNGGEDYELVFTFPHEYRPILEDLARQKEFSFSVVGEIVSAQEGCFLVDGAGKLRPLDPKGYQHFK